MLEAGRSVEDVVVSGLILAPQSPCRLYLFR
jgi:hypothetical protein